MRKVGTLFKMLSVALPSLAPTITLAALVSIETTPTSWRLQNYVPDNPVVYYSGSNCASGLLSFSANATQTDKDRFWSMVMAAKISKSKIIVIYDDETSNCQIHSFILQEE